MCVLLKTIWVKNGQQWKDKNDDKDEKQFLDWVREIVELKNMSLKKRYSDKDFEKLEMHRIGLIASLESMCIVNFLPVESDDGVKLIFGKGKCEVQNCLVKQQMIPKLEVQAALYSVRLRHLVNVDHNIHLQSVLQWVHSSHRNERVFVANRLG